MKKIQYRSYIHHPCYFVIYIACSIIQKAAIVFIPVLTQQMIDAAVSGSYRLLNRAGLSTLVMTVIFLISLYLKSKSQLICENDITYGLKTAIAERILYSDYKEIVSKEKGYYLQRYNKDIEGASFLFFEAKIQLAINIVYFAVLAVSMFFMNLKISIFLLLTIPVFLIVNAKAMPRIEKLGKEYFKQEEHLNSALEETILGAYTARASRIQKALLDRHQRKISEVQSSKLNYILSDEKYDVGVVNGLMNLCNFVIYWYGGILTLRGEISVGVLFALVLYFGRIWSPVEFFLGYKKRVQEARISEERLIEILRLEKDQTPRNKANQRGAVVLSNISYETQGKSIFNNACLSLPETGLIYITGENGSGKTTLFNLISQVVQAQISVTVNGKAVENEKQFLIDHVYFEPAEPFLFNGSIYENCFDHGQDDKILQLEGILKKKVSAASSSLSSGEKKIVQLFRAFNRKEPIIIFDEPLNYLGAEYKQFVLDLLKEMKAEKLILVSSHDPIIAEISDRIISIGEISNVS